MQMADWNAAVPIARSRAGARILDPLRSKNKRVSSQRTSP
jgi:hypothetical protein